MLSRTLHPKYKYADYLSAVKYYSNGRLLSRFRSGCHGPQGVGTTIPRGGAT